MTRIVKDTAIKALPIRIVHNLGTNRKIAHRAPQVWIVNRSKARTMRFVIPYCTSLSFPRTVTAADYDLAFSGCRG